MTSSVDTQHKKQELLNKSKINFDQWEDFYAHRVNSMRSSATRDLFGAASRSDIISFSGGMPDVRLVSKEVLHTTLKELVDQDLGMALQYGSTDGRPQTKAIVRMLMEEIGVSGLADADIAITTGAQQGLDLIGKTFINPGDTIIVEAPTYLGALQAFSAYQPQVRAVPFDDEGMRTDLLAELLEELGPRGAKFLYTIPTFQNPGGVTMSLERRQELLRLCNEYEIPVVEDDPYSRLRFSGEPVACLRSMDDKVIYLGTFSKIFAPGLRLGWMIAPRPILKKVLLTKQGTDLCGSAFNQVAAEHYFADTPWRETLESFIQKYKSRRDALLDAMEEYFPKELSWTKPEGGFFVWVTLPDFIDTDELLPAALEKGLTFVPGSGCFPDRTSNSLRLAFCYEAEDDLREGARRLAALINERLVLYRAFMEAGYL